MFKYAFIILGLFVQIFACPIPASINPERTTEWRDDGLWVIDPDTGPQIFPQLSVASEPDVFNPRVAQISPDGEWIAFVRHTGGGYENEGQSCFVARWDGAVEVLLLATDLTIPAIYWLEGNGKMYVAVQEMSGGTAYHCFFSVMDFESRSKITSVEGLIYGTASYGTRAQGTYPKSNVGVKYEVLCQNENPCEWGALYVDELIDFGWQNGMRMGVWSGKPDDASLIDGSIRVPWLSPETDIPPIDIGFLPPDQHQFPQGYKIPGVFIISGWAYHEPPLPEFFMWEGNDCFRQYGRPKDIELGFSDGTKITQTLEDTPLPQWLSFPEEIQPQNIQSEEDPFEVYIVAIKVLSIYRGRDYPEMAISEIYLP